MIPVSVVTTAHAIQLVSVSKVYGSGLKAVTALNQVSVGLAKGSFTAVMGPSGSGKSCSPRRPPGWGCCCTAGLAPVDLLDASTLAYLLAAALLAATSVAAVTAHHRPPTFPQRTNPNAAPSRSPRVGGVAPPGDSES